MQISRAVHPLALVSRVESRALATHYIIIAGARRRFAPLLQQPGSSLHRDFFIIRIHAAASFSRRLVRPAADLLTPIFPVN